MLEIGNILILLNVGINVTDVFYAYTQHFIFQDKDLSPGSILPSAVNVLDVFNKNSNNFHHLGLFESLLQWTNYQWHTVKK